MHQLFPPLNCFWPFVKNHWTFLCVSVFWFSILFIDLCVYPSFKTVCDQVLKFGRLIHPTLFSFSRIILAILVALYFYLHFRITLSISIKKNLVRIFIRIELNLLSIFLKLISFLYWVFQFIKMVCLHEFRSSISLVSIVFFSIHVHAFLELCLSLHFLRLLIVFLIL